MKIKDRLLDIRVHIGVALLAFAVMIISYITSNAEKISDMPVYGMIAAWVFSLILVLNVTVRVVLAWVITPFLKLFTDNRK